MAKVRDMAWLKERIKVDDNDCWLWQKSVMNTGYGQYGDGKTVHRLAWELTNGPIPKGMCVCHTCDVRHCANPDHLFVGTAADNIKDMDKKGRRKFRVGQSHAQSKLTESQVLGIRERDKRGESRKAMAREFHVCKAMIYLICTGERWKSLLPTTN
mgnify:CR=1 FL=1